MEDFFGEDYQRGRTGYLSSDERTSHHNKTRWREKARSVWFFTGECERLVFEQEEIEESTRLRVHAS